jgi:hypothetical protein
MWGAGSGRTCRRRKPQERPGFGWGVLLDHRKLLPACCRSGHETISTNQEGAVIDNLELYRRTAIRQIEDEKLRRTERLQALKREEEELEAQNIALVQAFIRANRSLPEGSCPRCWIWDGTAVKLSPQPSAHEYDVMRCLQCRNEYTVTP